MVKQYSIVGYGNAGHYLDFEDAILVKVVSTDDMNSYSEFIKDPSCEEERMQCEHWLMFKNYHGKYHWVQQKVTDCDNGKVWYLDIENDFITRSTCITNNKTGDSFIRPICQVVMINPSLDAVEAKEKGEPYKGRNGVQKRLDELELPLEGNEIKYYIVGKDSDDEYYGIAYDYEEKGGLYYADRIYINPFNRDISVKELKVGVYNPMRRQLMKFVK